jgi:hypothetical protein
MTPKTKKKLREILDKLYWHDRRLAVSRERTQIAIDQALTAIIELWEEEGKRNEPL